MTVFGEVQTMLPHVPWSFPFAVSLTSIFFLAISLPFDPTEEFWSFRDISALFLIIALEHNKAWMEYPDLIIRANCLLLCQGRGNSSNVASSLPWKQCHQRDLQMAYAPFYNSWNTEQSADQKKLVVFHLSPSEIKLMLAKDSVITKQTIIFISHHSLEFMVEPANHQSSCSVYIFDVYLPEKLLW